MGTNKMMKSSIRFSDGIRIKMMEKLKALKAMRDKKKAMQAEPKAKDQKAQKSQAEPKAMKSQAEPKAMKSQAKPKAKKAMKKTKKKTMKAMKAMKNKISYADALKEMKSWHTKIGIPTTMLGYAPDAIVSFTATDGSEDIVLSVRENVAQELFTNPCVKEGELALYRITYKKHKKEEERRRSCVEGDVQHAQFLKFILQHGLKLS